MSRLHQASCVAIAGRGLMIEGAPGSGKSTLALMLIDRGALLVGDDGVSLEQRQGRLVAGPPPRIGGLIEVRNLGLFELPTSSPVPVALVLRIEHGAPRFIEAAEQTELEGVKLPMVRVWPGGHELALKAEFALTRFGHA